MAVPPAPVGSVALLLASWVAVGVALQASQVAVEALLPASEVAVWALLLASEVAVGALLSLAMRPGAPSPDGKLAGLLVLATSANTS